jgi:hypothetical protein
MEDACDIELLRKSLIDRTVHGTLLAGTLGRPSPRRSSWLSFSSDPSSPIQRRCSGASF